MADPIIYYCIVKSLNDIPVNWVYNGQLLILTDKLDMEEAAILVVPKLLIIAFPLPGFIMNKQLFAFEKTRIDWYILEKLII